MRSKGSEEEWDFTPVIDLIYSLSAGHEDPARDWVSPPQTPERPSTPIASTGLEDIKSQLGNFDKLFKFLGQPLNIPPPCVPLGDTYALNVGLQYNDTPEKTILHSSSPPKVVRWRDELEGADLEDNDELGHARSVALLTKAQSKKERKNELKKKQHEILLRTGGRSKFLQSASDVESENELQYLRPSPDRRAIIQQILHGTPTKYHRAISLSPSSSRSPPKDSHTSSGHCGWPISKPIKTDIPQVLFASPEQADLALAAARKVKLLTKLNARFVDERQFLHNISFTQYLQGVGGDGLLEGVHVFVDASNVSWSYLKVRVYDIST